MVLLKIKLPVFRALRVAAHRTIVGLLAITEKEQKHMKQFIGQEEADKRVEESGKKSIGNQMEKKIMMLTKHNEDNSLKSKNLHLGQIFQLYTLSNVFIL